jgi:hypothetical protein
MPRVGQVKALGDERLTDRIAIGVLTSMFPPALVDEVLEATGRVEQRHRLLPARVVVYFTLAMCLWADEGCRPRELSPRRVPGLVLER